MWIESEVAPAKKAEGGVGAGDGKLTEATTKAREMVASGQLKEAVQRLQEGLVACSQERDRFLWRLHIAQLCHDAQRFQLAVPLLEQCQEEVNRYHIGEWEPSLAAEVARTLYKCRKALTSSDKQPAPEALKGVRESFAWLCQLDPVAALTADPAGK
jgi:predicted negative regulator of RcsB-dependent stress response